MRSSTKSSRLPRWIRYAAGLAIGASIALLITGSGETETMGFGHFQDLDQVAMAAPVCKYARLVDRAGVSKVSVVHSGSPAEKAGIAAGDIAVALDNLRLHVGTLDLRLREHHVGDTVTISVFRVEHLMRFPVKLGAPPEDTCYLELESDPDARTEKMRAAWLTGGK